MPPTRKTKRNRSSGYLRLVKDAEDATLNIQTAQAVRKMREQLVRLKAKKENTDMYVFFLMPSIHRMS